MNFQILILKYKTIFSIFLFFLCAICYETGSPSFTHAKDSNIYRDFEITDATMKKVAEELKRTFNFDLDIKGSIPNISITTKLHNVTANRALSEVLNLAGVNNYILIIDREKNIIRILIAKTDKNNLKIMASNDIRNIYKNDNYEDVLATETDNQKASTQLSFEQTELLIKESNKTNNANKIDNIPLSNEQLKKLLELNNNNKLDSENLTKRQIDELITIDKDLYPEETILTPEQLEKLIKDSYVENRP